MKSQSFSAPQRMANRSPTSDPAIPEQKLSFPTGENWISRIRQRNRDLAVGASKAGNAMRCFRPRLLLELEQVLQRELHDSWIPRILQNTKQLIVLRCEIRQCSRNVRSAYQWPEAIGHVVSFNAEFQALSFRDLEGSRQSHVPIPRRWPREASAAHVSQCTHCRLLERREVEPLSARPSRPVAIRIRVHLIRRLLVYRRSIPGCVEIVPGGDR